MNKDIKLVAVPISTLRLLEISGNMAEREIMYIFPARRHIPPASKTNHLMLGYFMEVSINRPFRIVSFVIEELPLNLYGRGSEAVKKCHRRAAEPAKILEIDILFYS